MAASASEANPVLGEKERAEEIARRRASGNPAAAPYAHSVSEILVGTASGCRVFDDGGERVRELDGRAVGALAAEPEGTCLAVVDGGEIARRDTGRAWSTLARTELALVSVARAGDRVVAGSMGDADLIELDGRNGGEPAPMPGFAQVPGRDTWHAVGPPLHVRAIAATSDGSALFAATHVGGIARSTDGGGSWSPTIPIDWDVHEVCVHESPPLVAAVSAVGLLVSEDAGETWRRFDEGPDVLYSLAVAVVGEEVLFSVQDGPFASRSQIWRWRIGGSTLEQVRDGLPEWLEGKVDTHHIAVAGGRAAIADRGGTLWLSEAGSRGWQPVATDLEPASSVLML